MSTLKTTKVTHKDNSGSPNMQCAATGNTVFAADIQSTSQNSGQLAGLRNQIINGNFLIWQRGTTNTPDAEAGYNSADRWRMSGQTVLTKSTNTPEGFAYSGLVSRASGARQLQYGIEVEEAASSYPDGSVFTLSYWSTVAIDTVLVRFSTGMGEAGIGTITVGTAVAGETNNGFTHYSHTVTIGAHDNTPTLLYFVWQDGSNFNLTGAQFEPGTIATPFEERPIGLELMLCQRYYTKVDGGIFMNAASRTTPNDSAILPYQLPTTMRVAPTIVGTPVVSNGTYSTTNNLTKDGASFFATSTSSTNTARITSDLEFDAEL